MKALALVALAAASCGGVAPAQSVSQNQQAAPVPAKVTSAALTVVDANNAVLGKFAGWTPDAPGRITFLSAGRLWAVDSATGALQLPVETALYDTPDCSGTAYVERLSAQIPFTVPHESGVFVVVPGTEHQFFGPPYDKSSGTCFPSFANVGLAGSLLEYQPLQDAPQPAPGAVTVQ